MEEMTPSEGRKKGGKETNIDVNWGLDLEMSPWKSGGGVSYARRFCLTLYLIKNSNTDNNYRGSWRRRSRACLKIF